LSDQGLFVFLRVELSAKNRRAKNARDNAGAMLKPREHGKSKD
jgi:hypothetical protein